MVMLHRESFASRLQEEHLQDVARTCENPFQPNLGESLLSGTLIVHQSKGSMFRLLGRSQAGVTDNDEACFMHLILRMAHKYPRLWMHATSVCYAQKYPAFFFEKRIGATSGILVSRQQHFEIAGAQHTAQ